MSEDTKDISFLRHAIIYGVGSMAAPASSFIVLPLYTHYLTPADYGSLQFIYRIGAVFHICLMIGGLRLATFYLYGKQDDQHSRKHAAASITCFTFVVLLVGAVLTIAFGNLLDSILSFGNPTLLILGVLTLKARSLTVMPLAMMQARFESTAFVVINLLIAVCHVALVALTLVVLGWGVWGVLFTIALTHGLFGSALMLRELMRTTWKPDPSQIIEIARFAMPFIPAGVCFFLMHNGDHFFLMKYSGAAVLGIYALGYQFVYVIETISTVPLHQVWQPWMYRVYHKVNGPELLGQATTRIVGVFAFLATGLVMFRHEILELMGSPAYAGATLVIPVLALAYFHLTFADLAEASFFVTRKTGYKPIVSAFSAVFIVVAYALLIPPCGALGAAYATLLGFMFHSIITLLVAQRVYRISYEPKRLAMLLISACILSATTHLLEVSVMGIIVKSLLWLGWPLLLWAGGFFSAEEELYIRNGIRKAFDLLSRVRSRAIASETN